MATLRNGSVDTLDSLQAQLKQAAGTQMANLNNATQNAAQTAKVWLANQTQVAGERIQSVWNETKQQGQGVVISVTGNETVNKTTTTTVSDGAKPPPATTEPAKKGAVWKQGECGLLFAALVLESVLYAVLA